MRKSLASLLAVAWFICSGFVPGTFSPLLSANPLPSIVYQTISSNTTSLTTYTFSSIAIGAADPTRSVIVYVGGSNNGRAAPTVTVNGIACTSIVSVIGGANATSALDICPVPTLTTATIVVTWSAGQVRTTIATWAAYHLTVTNAAAATNTSVAATASLNLNLLGGDIVVVAGESGTAISAAATGYTARFSQADAAMEWYAGGDFTATVNETPRTLTITFTGTTPVASVAASFR